jgi:short-subunit dehydrogenase
MGGFHLDAVYYASKAYVLSFPESLAIKLTGSGDTFTVLGPGPTAIGFAVASKMKIRCSSVF